jgi:8-oxo-dGTP diphosphatase
VQEINVVAAIFLKGERVFVAKRAAHKSLAGKWEFPGGKIEKGEDANSALIRELKEELGVSCQVGEFFLRAIDHQASHTVIIDSYLVTWDGQVTMDGSHDQFLWASASELRALDLCPADIEIAVAVQEKLTASDYIN